MRAVGLPDGPLRILCLGAHSDDIEIGCGATLLELLSRHPGSSVTWVVLSASNGRAAEARASAADLLQGVPDKAIHVANFHESYFPWQGERIKEAVEALKPAAPDLIFTHWKDDAHQDHRTVADLTWNSFRNHLILEYEIPKYESDLGHPNVYVPVSAEQARRKIAGLMRHFASQQRRPWFTEDTFHALMRLRGVNAQSPSGLAEAFHCRKMCL